MFYQFRKILLHYYEIDYSFSVIIYQEMKMFFRFVNCHLVEVLFIMVRPVSNENVLLPHLLQT